MSVQVSVTFNQSPEGASNGTGRSKALQTIWLGLALIGPGCPALWYPDNTVPPTAVELCALLSAHSECTEVTEDCLPVRCGWEDCVGSIDVEPQAFATQADVDWLLVECPEEEGEFLSGYCPELGVAFVDCDGGSPPY